MSSPYLNDASRYVRGICQNFNTQDHAEWSRHLATHRVVYPYYSKAFHRHNNLNKRLFESWKWTLDTVNSSLYDVAINNIWGERLGDLSEKKPNILIVVKTGQHTSSCINHVLINYYFIADDFLTLGVSVIFILWEGWFVVLKLVSE